jgi:hypothetical protein
MIFVVDETLIQIDVRITGGYGLHNMNLIWICVR